MIHKPVLLKEIIEILNPQKNQDFIDATIGEGGITLEILKRTSPKGKVLGIDLDKEILKEAQKNLAENGLLQRVVLVNGNYRFIKEIARKSKFFDPKGIIFDLGFSRWHIEKSGRGFSFRRKEILDMRYDKSFKLTSFEIINKWPPKEIEKILREYGEEKHAKRIVKEIVRARQKTPIYFASDLSKIIEKVVPKRKRIHPATKTFQALRIFINQELENLKEGLKGALELLQSGGKIVIVSYHSLEDRVVKNFFKEKAREGSLKIVTPKPIVPKKIEVLENPSARSAKLRAAIKN
jgi:16S rRNA (cytosine1402-N4)-methyltransferase